MVTIKIKILDLFCGLGGVARGFQTYLIENGIDFEYHAVDINPRILLAHKIINPYSLTIKRDAYSFTDEELKKYDFIWASPPCETHSIAILWKKEKPDMRLYELISKLYNLGKPFIVENVKPYYNPPIKPTSKVCRHRLWSNLKITPINLRLQSFHRVKDDVKTLIRYHELNDVSKKILKIMGNVRKARDALRDMVHWRIAYKIAEQVIPQVMNGKRLHNSTLSDF